MQKIFVILMCALALSCQENKEPVDYVVLKGTIKNAPDKLLSFYSNNQSIRDTLFLNDNGAFLDTLKLSSGFYNIVDKKNIINLYLQPGNVVDLNYDANDINNTMKISGEGSLHTNYLFNKNQILKKYSNFRSKELYLKPQDSFKMAVNAWKTSADSLVNVQLASDKEFLENELKNINYQYLLVLNGYERSHGYYTENREFKAEPGFLPNMDDIAYNNEEDYKFSDSYRSLVSSHYSNLVRQQLAIDSTMDYDLNYLKQIATNDNQYIKDAMLYEEARFGLSYSKNPKQYFEIFSNNSSNKENIAAVKADYDKLMKLEVGQPSPQFNGYENFKGGDTSLKDLKGKYVYIDVWATWCGPCIGEIPSLKKLEEEFHGKNIEFVSISVDDKKDYDKWRKMVEEKELSGTQLFADNGWKSQFVDDYLIKGIPRFILLDTEGNIIESNATRPSSPKTAETFKSLGI